MEFERVNPPDHLKHLINHYWIVKGSDPAPRQQKIIPDGYPEIIFHFGEPYRINLSGAWTIQSNMLLAGQLTKYFYLENTGVSKILGVKLQPTALTQLFNTDQSTLTDKVVDLADERPEIAIQLKPVIAQQDITACMNIINSYFSIHATDTNLILPVENALVFINSNHGMVSVAAICEAAGTSERQLERLFKQSVGLSPKFYSRIIRFNYIFQVAQRKKISWSEVGLESGFYDQSHFIRNFKSFAGEDPSRYFFDEPSLANFFLKK